MDTRDYLALVKHRSHIESDYALAKLLRVRTQTVSMWQSGQRQLDAQNCYKVAELLELRADFVLADIERERAEKAGKPEDVTYWKGWVAKLGELGGKIGGGAAALLLGAAISGPNPARASIGAGSQPSEGHDIHCRGLRRLLHGRGAFGHMTAALA